MRILMGLLLAAALCLGADISGDWVFSVETEQGSGSPNFTFKQEGEKLTGTYSGVFGTANLAGTVKGDDIEFKVKVEISGQSGEILYTGKIVSATEMKGKVRLGEYGEGTWTGKKK